MFAGNAAGNAGPGAEPLAERLAAAALATGLVGRAPAFVRAVADAVAFARSGAMVLISGETGTGKELVARAVHYLSPRAAAPFLAVNCGALPDSLLEDELFGHERGAFTDARTRRGGLLAQAERGSLFLDEVDSLSPRAQVMLLRVLQEKTYRPLGSTREQSFDVRFIAATNVPLAGLVEAGAYRADLFYRLSVLRVSLPPLRERREDILALAAHLLRKNLPSDHPEPCFSPAAAAALLSHGWPGNVRELENAVIRGVHLAEGGVIEPEALGLAGHPSVAAGAPPPASEAPTATPPAEAAAPAGASFQALKQRAIDAFERDYLLHAMAAHDGNVTRAARAAGKERREFGKLLKKHHLDSRLFARQH